MTPEEQKEIFKQAIKEWMDDQYALLGRWVVTKLLIAGVTAFLLWYVTTNHKLPF